jgi:hypothetical protein
MRVGHGWGDTRSRGFGVRVEHGCAAWIHTRTGRRAQTPCAPPGCARCDSSRHRGATRRWERRWRSERRVRVRGKEHRRCGVSARRDHGRAVRWMRRTLATVGDAAWGYRALRRHGSRAALTRAFRRCTSGLRAGRPPDISIPSASAHDKRMCRQVAATRQSQHRRQACSTVLDLDTVDQCSNTCRLTGTG